MSVRHFVLRPDQRGCALNVVGTKVTVLVRCHRRRDSRWTA